MCFVLLFLTLNLFYFSLYLHSLSLCACRCYISLFTVYLFLSILACLPFYQSSARDYTLSLRQLILLHDDKLFLDCIFSLWSNFSLTTSSLICFLIYICLVLLFVTQLPSYLHNLPSLWVDNFLLISFMNNSNLHSHPFT